MIETRLLSYFLAIAREQNITKAAQALYVTQSTLSKQMMDLEKQLDKKLFIRGKRKVTLTEEGVFFRSRAQEILELLENTESALRADAEDLAGDITIGCAETTAMDGIARIISDFHEQHPGVQFRFYSGNADAVLYRIEKGLADMGLLLGPIRQEKYDYLNLHKKDIYGLLMPSDCELAARESVNLDQLSNLPLILSDQLFEGHQDLDWFGFSDPFLHVVATYNLIYNATFLVERGLGYALCLANLVNTKERNLTFRPISPELSVDLYIVTKKYRTFSPAAKAFYDRIRTHIGAAGKRAL